MADREYTVARQAESTARQLQWDSRFDGEEEAAAVPAVRRGRMDAPFLALTLILLVFGVVMILSASFARAYYTMGDPTKYFIRQTAFAGGGTALMLVVSRMSVATFRRAALPLLIASVGLLAIVPAVGARVNGAKRWIDLGFTTFQPSEIAKLAEVLIFSAMICAFKQRMKTVRYGVLPFVAVVAVFVALLVMEPHLSAIVIISAVAAIMMFAGGTRLYWFALMGGGAAAFAYIALTKLQYASERITAWLDPEAVAGDQGYQIMQSLYAIGSGGLFGLGLGQGRQKYLYLPMEHNDYIFSICCEELGFIGAMLILSLFAMLIVRGYWLALHASSRFGSLVVTGLTSLLAIQVFLNIAVVTNILPSTGISLPFFSYGGTALLIQMAEMGIILAISRDIPVSRRG
ncbi:MAG: putative lipid II flippase FtsW [Oscillospiraceae bacterium]|jgi:cell division protein FtsW|nr:putative lipid II flippase FtsW [Oscillospiraceae bacterium]